MKDLRSLAYDCRYCQHEFGDPNEICEFIDWLANVWTHLALAHKLPPHKSAFVNDHLQARYA